MPTAVSNVRFNRPPSNSKADPRYRREMKLTGVKSIDKNHRAWWKCSESEVAGVLGQLVQRIDMNNIEYRERMMRYARLYGNYEVLGMANLTASDVFRATNNMPVYNIIQSSVDTVMSKIVRDNPTPYFITSGADYFDKLKAEKMTQLVQGGFQQMDLYEIANNKVFRDSGIYGAGWVQFEYDPLKKMIDAEWCFIDEIKFDMYDAQKGRPMSLHRCKMVPKEVLIAKYPDQEELIESVNTQHPNLFRSNDTVIDFVVYLESWHLASGKNPGRHVISLTDKVLVDEEYSYDWYPLVQFQYYQKPAGMTGRGIPETILSGQIEINKILLAIQQCQELQARPVIIVDNDSQISSDSILNNRIARMIKIKSGTRPPEFLSPTGANPEIYNHLNSWMDWCRQEVGITQTAQNGAVRPGVNSAVGMRTAVDIESSRFIQVSKNWEQFFVRCAEVYIKLARQAYKANKDFKVRYTDKKSKIIKDIHFDKMNLPDDAYTIRCDTVSAFPQTATGRIQTITEFISNNFISRERGMELLQLDPDLEDEVKLQTSSLRLVEKTLCTMVEDGKYEHPEKYLNLKLALTVSDATYNQLKLDGCPEDRLQLVRLYIGELCTMISGTDETTQLLQQAFAPPAAGAPIAPQQGLQAA